MKVPRHTLEPTTYVRFSEVLDSLKRGARFDDRAIVWAKDRWGLGGVNHMLVDVPDVVGLLQRVGVDDVTLEVVRHALGDVWVDIDT